MFNELKESFDNLIVKVDGIKTVVDSHNPTILKFNKLEQRVIGGWVILTVIGIGAILMMKVYMRSIVTDIVNEVVASYDFETLIEDNNK